MGVKRYTAIADTTITNAFKLNLRTRATGSNMGLSDSLEVFHIYGQESSGSSEKSRILVKFKVTGSNSLKTDRTNKKIPAKDNVSFYLRLFNVRHPFTLPRNYHMTIAAISQSWNEGTGLDMESYNDQGAANWTDALSGAAGVTTWVSGGGGAFHASPTYSAYFDKGTEDIEVDITTLVEQWIVGSTGGSASGKENFGIGVYLSNESESSSSYTKKFSSRGSEFFFRRPVIEARWDSAKKDDRGNFYYSSSLAPAEDNLNTLYLYNRVRGRLRDIPGIGQGDNILVSLFSGSGDNSKPYGSALNLPISVPSVKTIADLNATGGWVATGIYSCSFAATASATPLTKLFDVWHSSSTQQSPQYFTGSIVPTTLAPSNINPYVRYAMNISNLRDVYYRDETAQFRLFTRQKDWSPTIYSKATAEAKPTIIDSASFKVVRIVDEYEAIPFGTGSDMHTQLSFDASGSYFDLDLTMLEAGYAYGIKFAFYDEGAKSWNEYPDVFKFRVEE
tara:strand:- start:532 stop:2046 length:1515 start_codon:yes stop_codon:yes gene_type:complete